MYEAVGSCVDLRSMNDEELMVEYRVFGNISCFDEIVRRYEPELSRFLHSRYGLSAQELEEALQATFTRVWEKRDQFDSSRRLRAWIFRIAVSQTANLFRRRALRGGTVSLDASDDRGAWAESLPSPKSDPTSALEASETARRVRDAANNLPTRYREIVDMVFYQGLSFGAVASKLNIASTTVSRRLKRALQLLSAALLTGRLSDTSDYALYFVERVENAM